MAAYVVTAPGVQIKVGSRAYFLERGQSVPEGVDEETLTRLESRGYITAVDAAEPDVEETVVLKPLERMTKAELDEIAKAEGIDLTGITKNADKVAAITAFREASATPVEAAPADPAGDPDETAPAGSDL